MTIVEETRTAVAGPGATPEAQAEVRAAGGQVLPTPRPGRPTVPEIISPPASAQPPPSTSTTPAEGAARSQAPEGSCMHDKGGHKLLPIAIQSANPTYAHWCTGCGALGPTSSRVPTLAQWMLPGDR